MLTPVPVETGLRLVELLRRHGSTPFILMLSEREQLVPGEQVRLGVVSFLMKLSDTVQLLYAMEETLDDDVSHILSETLWRGKPLVPGQDGTMAASMWVRASRPMID